MFWGSSNVHPVRGKKLDMSKHFRPGEEVALFNLEAEKMVGSALERIIRIASAVMPKGPG